MIDIYYSDDCGEEYDFISSHPDLATAQAEASRLNAILHDLVTRSKAFESTESSIKECLQAESDFIRAQPEWQILCTDIPSVFTNDADPFELGFNAFPTIDVRDNRGKIIPFSQQKTGI